MDTLAACGDVNRNVMCNPNPFESHIHAQVDQFARDLSAHLSPRTGAYHEIWLDKKVRVCMCMYVYACALPCMFLSVRSPVSGCACMNASQSGLQ